jgi:alpha-1,3/alpha-1,6-mannosyltransferase
MKVLYVHPDLGVGGAERLIVDAALATQSSGHEVSIITNQYNPSHCFEDTKSLDIIVKFNWIPRQVFGRFHALLAYMKIFLASIWLVYFSGLKYDVAIVDQISLPVFVFKLNKIKVLFYCHFPDKLLCIYDKRNFLKKLYRLPIDWLEMKTTGMADVILVNSKFTSNVFYETFSSLKDKKIDVLYPSLNTDVFDACLKKFESSSNQQDEVNEPKASSILEDIVKQDNLIELEKSKNKKIIFLSINRYERKKDLKLALNAMLTLKQRFEYDNKEWCDVHLVMAGGYDWRVHENVQHYEELKSLAKSLRIDENISFLRSISDQQKVSLLKKAFCLLYTPTNEHFGIVPVESMYCEKPVIATKTGGPLETVAHDKTGYLVDSNADEFSKAMYDLINSPDKHSSMCSAARTRVIQNFSFKAFQEKLNNILNGIKEADQKKDE